MSLPWRDAVLAFVSPQQVSVQAVRRAWRQRAAPCIVEACAAGPAALAVPAALALALSRLQPSGPPRRWAPRPAVRIVLSHQLAALTLLPHARALQNTEERRAAARHAFAAVYGASTADWWIVVDPSKADTALAAGLDGPLAEGLRRAVAQQGMAVHAIEPLLSAATALASASLRDGPAWLAVAEAGRVVLARHEGRIWRSLRTHRPRGTLAADLGAWIDQARLIDGIEGADRVIVAGAELGHLEALDRPGWSLVQAPCFAWQGGGR